MMWLIFLIGFIIGVNIGLYLGNRRVRHAINSIVFPTDDAEYED